MRYVKKSYYDRAIEAELDDEDLVDEDEDDDLDDEDFEEIEEDI